MSTHHCRFEAPKLRVTDVTGFNTFFMDWEDITYDDMAGLAKEIEEMKGEHSKGIDRVFPCIWTYLYIQWCQGANIYDLQ
jgi:hypothetical protein